jgi:hypothetical protein
MPPPSNNFRYGFIETVVWWRSQQLFVKRETVKLEATAVSQPMEL